jgi:hypothetical protein
MLWELSCNLAETAPRRLGLNNRLRTLTPISAVRSNSQIGNTRINSASIAPLNIAWSNL